MKKTFILYYLFLLTQTLFSQNSLTFREKKINRQQLIFGTLSIGYANTNLMKYRNWAKQVNLQSVEASEDYLTFGAEIGALFDGHHFQFEFMTSGRTLKSISPNLTQFGLRYGQIIHSYKRIDFVASGGLGYCGYAIRFAGNPPPYLAALPYNPVNAYAQQSSFLFSPEIAMFVRPASEGNFFFALRVGYNIDIARSVWKYGTDVRVRSSRNGSSTRFIGQEVSGIPSGIMQQFLYTKLSFGFAF